MGKPPVAISKKVFIELHNEGKSGLEIARFFNIGRTTVGRYYKRYELTPWTTSEIRKRKFWRGTPETYKKISEMGKARTRDKNPMWKGGHTSEGYPVVYKNGRKMREHRYIMEQYLGRRLRTAEEVHHVDHNKFNNDINNLIVLSKADHAKLHWSELTEQEQSEKMAKLNEHNKQKRQELTN